MVFNRMRKYLYSRKLCYKKRLIHAENRPWIQRQEFPGFLRPDPLDAAEGGLPAQNGYTSALPL